MKKELLAIAIASTLLTGAQALADHHEGEKADGAKAEKSHCKGESKKGHCGGKAMKDGKCGGEAKKDGAKCSGAGGCPGK